MSDELKPDFAALKIIRERNEQRLFTEAEVAEHERLAVAGAIEAAAKLLDARAEATDSDSFRLMARTIRALTPADAQAALDARVQEAYRQGIEQGMQTHKVAMDEALRQARLDQHKNQRNSHSLPEEECQECQRLNASLCAEGKS